MLKLNYISISYNRLKMVKLSQLISLMSEKLETDYDLLNVEIKDLKRDLEEVIDERGFDEKQTRIYKKLIQLIQLLIPERLESPELTSMILKIKKLFRSGKIDVTEYEVRADHNILTVFTMGWRGSTFKWEWMPEDKNFKQLYYRWVNTNGRYWSEDNVWDPEKDVRVTFDQLREQIQTLSG